MYSGGMNINYFGLWRNIVFTAFTSVRPSLDEAVGKNGNDFNAGKGTVRVAEDYRICTVNDFGDTAWQSLLSRKFTMPPNPR